MYRSASWNRSSHRVVPAKVIAVAAATPARVFDTTESQSPVAVIPSRSVLATRANSLSLLITSIARLNTPC